MINAVALVDGTEVDYEVIIEDQLVTLKVDREQLDKIAGQELTLQITAQIKAGVEVEVIDNEATIQVNDNPSEQSNKVPVIPPPEIEKDIDGEKAEEPVEKLRGEEYDYNVTTTLPQDVSGFKTVLISDDLDERLSVVEAKVLVDGETSDIQANIDGQLVTVLLENDQIAPFAGKEIKLVITAKINADVEIEVIDNQASIQVNDNPKVDSNKVPVIPPTTPNIEKDVEGDIEKIETSLPLLVTCQQGLNEPRYPSLPGIMKARSKPLEELEIDDLDLDEDEVEPKTKTMDVFLPPEKQAGRILEGDIEDQVKELVSLLHTEAKVL